MSHHLCNSFRELALNTWHAITLSRDISFQLKEETFTDANLFMLKLKHPDELYVKAFNKIEEGTVGADWEWWFNDGGRRWLGLRVQAKIINLKEDEFAHLHYQGKNSIPQSEKLIIQAEANTLFPCIPVYCLYLTTNISDTTIYPDPLAASLHGCAILSAFQVKDFRATKEKRLEHLWPYLKPWHSLVCHDPGQSIIDHLNRLSRSYLTQDRRSERPLWINDPPPYVYSLIESGNIKQSDDQKPIDLAGVVVIRTRPE
jgi:hypothetical protein